eukprot:SAG31_NODE_589_length_13808_cov_3.896710_2_plen_82_part_00
MGFLYDRPYGYNNVGGFVLDPEQRDLSEWHSAQAEWTFGTVCSAPSLSNIVGATPEIIQLAGPHKMASHFDDGPPSVCSSS